MQNGTAQRVGSAACEGVIPMAHIRGKGVQVDGLVHGLRDLENKRRQVREGHLVELHNGRGLITKAIDTTDPTGDTANWTRYLNEPRSTDGPGANVVIDHAKGKVQWLPPDPSRPGLLPRPSHSTTQSRTITQTTRRPAVGLTRDDAICLAWVSV